MLSPHSRSRSGDRHKSHHKKSKDKSKSRSGSKKKKYRFDSPPKEGEQGALAGASSSSLLHSIQEAALVQAARVDRKLYVGNLPPGINPPMVSNHFIH
jgi:hypothetical protein